MSSPQLSTIGLPADRILAALKTGEAILEGILGQEDMLKAFCQRWREIVNAEASAIFLVFPREDVPARIELVSESNANNFTTKHKVSLPVHSVIGGGLTSHLACEGKIAVLSGRELTNNPYLRHVKTADADFLTNRTAYSLLAFPLKNRKGQLLGFIKAQNKLSDLGIGDPDGTFSETDIILASIMAARLVAALESKSLFRSVGEILRTPPQEDLDSYLRAILPAALQIVGANRGSVSLWQDEPAPPGLYVRAQVGDGACGPADPIPEESVIATVWKQGDPVLIADVEEFKGPYFKANPLTRSELAVMLSARSSDGTLHPLGVLNAEAFAPNGFDKQDQRVLEAVAVDMSSAIDLANQDEAHKKLLRRCTSENIRVLDQALEAVLQSLQSTFGFDGSLIYVTDHSRHVLNLRAALGCDKPEGYHHDCAANSLAAYVFRSQTATFVADPPTHKLVMHEGLQQFGIVGPLLALPLVHAMRVVGVLLVWSKRPMYSPRAEHRHRLYPFACVAAAQIAVEHAYWLLDTAMHQLSNRANILVEAIRVKDDEILTGESAKLESIVRRTLELRRFRRIPAEKSDFSLRGLVEEYSRRGTIAPDVQLVCELMTRSSCMFFGDRARIGIAIDELVSNAANHSPANAKVLLRLAENASSYTIEVVDDGSGIREKNAGSVFVPYQSFGPMKGSGLGLPIARERIAEHGGTLKWASGAGNIGTIFTVTLPKEGKSWM